MQRCSFAYLKDEEMKNESTVERPTVSAEETMMHILQSLQSNTNLSELVIECYSGSRFLK